MGPYNIVIFGETGSGKSSLVNLIVGSSVAEVSPDVAECTTVSKDYIFSGQDDVQYNLWDTPGLKEPQSKTDDQASAIAESYGLVQHLNDHGGADLLIYCISGLKGVQVPSAPPSTLQSHYRLFHEIFFPGVPLIIVVTHLDSRQEREKWWTRNEERLKRVEISSSGHTCVTAHSSSDSLELEESANSLRMLLAQSSRKSRWGPSVVLERFRRSKEAARSLASVTFSRWDMTVSERIMAGMLTARCGLEKDEVVALVKRMRAPSRSVTPLPIINDG
ncbi:P-loop containing nucleoside triphosphate hydrolase protein [Scleroderma citrinum]